ncbi:class II aldolase/adducin family protein [Micromonospora endophytica]|uniref:Class II aldolase family protein n=1 Tax=Micromonospora endophytica TaxID=515350 RepID=A0A2W2CPY5_9ACTN|nr:class II aldolase/adducin family protein [Micromonospora endophytica]PZG00633.1 class II aldolase family protein [Micromonospora endophytica]RIW51459.1 class II aldolase/adducin family protein [Micromonospora endophytica]BCJ62185.1 aldolase [Micromonospora endophytica]
MTQHTPTPSDLRGAPFGADELDAARTDLTIGINRIFAASAMSASGHGNISVRLPGHDNLLAINAGDLLRPWPTDDLRVGVPALRAVNDEVVVVDLDGEVRFGTPSPSVAAILKMHVGVYQTRPDVNAVIHTHSPYATSYALASVSLPARYEALLVHGQAVDIPVAPWAPRGTTEAVRAIAETYQAHPQTYGVLLGNHGLLVAGDDAKHAASLVVAIEEAAVSSIGALALGGPVPFPDHVKDVDLRLRF